LRDYQSFYRRCPLNRAETFGDTTYASKCFIGTKRNVVIGITKGTLLGTRSLVMRFRPRFSIRTRAIFVTLVCCYFGAWEATKRYGMPREVHQYGRKSYCDPFWRDTYSSDEPTALMPFVVRYGDGADIEFRWGYYLWLFGPQVRLPLGSDTVRYYYLPLEYIDFR
jgi:hypothetical protein